MSVYAGIIVDISSDKLDREFEYLVPQELEPQVHPGTMVHIPFGRRKITGYVVRLTDQPEYPVSKIKSIDAVCGDRVTIESQLIALAWWMRSCYGSTMNQALKTVLPVSKKTKPVENKTLVLELDEKQAKEALAEMERKHQSARARLMRALMQRPGLDYSSVIHSLKISASVVRALEEKGILRIEEQKIYRNPVAHMDQKEEHRILDDQQKAVVEAIVREEEQPPEAWLIKGVTGSGKTEVYMELIAHTLREGRQAIVLIPEIALTYQTVRRFYERFGDRVSIMNSRLSAGERYDQYLRAKNGDIDIMIGPRSALFAPFSNLGMIIIDEEHESSYKSETAPRYHARETAIRRAQMCGAKVVLGSATPSVESYFRAKQGRYRLLIMDHRVEEKPLPVCEIVDLRKELVSGNRSILSRTLQKKMEDCLRRGEQIMLFLNRRGMSSFVSCRACGHVIRCPHCDVSLSRHNNGRMICHYCGYSEPEPKRCPSCGSGYIAGFKAGTQKIQEIVQKRFPKARLLRMDYDTTRSKDSYERILREFSDHQADILIGTQMIVKGHDFPLVTLVGVLAADLSLHISDYRASERTFQLLAQAVGRAGRGQRPGQAVIQTYSPDNYAVQTAAEQNYEAFFEKEIAYRKLLRYPPVIHMLLIGLLSGDSDRLEKAAKEVFGRLSRLQQKNRYALQMIGPSDALIGKVNDVYRKVIYIKAKTYGELVAMKDGLDLWIRKDDPDPAVSIQYNFDPVNGF